MIAIDTNLLVYAHRAGTPQHATAKRVLTAAAEAADGWGISSAVIPEFWAVVTHPAAAGGPSTPVQARGFLRALTEAGAQVWLPGPGFGSRLVELARALSVRGPRILDLQIALSAYEGGAVELWTHDAAFVSVPGLPIRDPLPER